MSLRTTSRTSPTLTESCEPWAMPPSEMMYSRRRRVERAVGARMRPTVEKAGEKVSFAMLADCGSLL